MWVAKGLEGTPVNNLPLGLRRQGDAKRPAEVTAGWWAFTWTGRSDGVSMGCRHLKGLSLQCLRLGRCQGWISHFKVFNAGLFKSQSMICG